MRPCAPIWRVVAAVGAIVSAVIGILGTQIEHITAVDFLASDWIRGGCIATLIGFLWLWTTASGVNLFKPWEAALESLRRQTRQRLQEAHPGPGTVVSDREADEQVQRWEHFKEWLRRAEGRLRCHPEDLSAEVRADLLGMLNDARSSAGIDYNNDFSRRLFHQNPDGGLTITKRTQKTARSYLRDLRRSIRPWEMSTAIKLSRLDQPLRP